MKVSSSPHSLLYLLVFVIYLLPASDTAPVLEDGSQAMQTLDGGSGCYYNFEHYYEGDRILTNEPCLNCTCHNRMLMCYLRVCPFTKGIGQDCTVEKKPDQCCPVITCPQVPVALLTSSTTQQPPSTTALGRPDNYGCILNQNTFYPDGAQVPSDPKKPCELCYCIRNHTACVMQECTLNVEGCKPVFQEGICCPVRYDCDYEDALTTQRPTTVGLVTTVGGPADCLHDGTVYHDGEMVTIDNKQPCEHCYCMRGDIVCAVQECGTPLEGSDCTPLEPPPEQCCPTTYQCANGTIPIKGHETPEEGNQVKETPDHPHDEASVEEQSEEDKDKHDKHDESSQSEESEEENSSHKQSHPEASSVSSTDKHPDHDEVEHQAATEQVNELQTDVTTGSSVVTTEPKRETVEEEIELTPASESQSQEKTEEDTPESSTSVHSLPEHDKVESKPEVHLEESASEAPIEKEVEKDAGSSQTQEDNVKQTSENSKPEEELVTDKSTEKPMTILSADQENAGHHPNIEDSESQSSVVQSVEGEVPEDVTVEGQNNNHLATNEIPEIISTPVRPASNEQPLVESARVPGEGSCLVDGKTYPPDSDVPPSPDSCHKSCKCVNSIVQCERVECSLPPSNYANCMPVQTPDSCCPTYMCDQAPSDAPEIQNQLSIDKIDTNINEEGTLVEEQHGEHQTSASDSGDESATTSGQINEVQTVPPVVISGIPPENLVPGGEDEIALQPGPSEENLIGNNEDSTSSASSDNSVSQHVNEVNNVDHNQEIPISPVKTDESAIHEDSSEEITEHHHGKPVENNLVDSQNQHHHIIAGSEGGTEEQVHSEPSALHNENPTLSYDDLVTTENNVGLSEFGSDVHSEEPSEHPVSEQEQQNKDSDVNGSVNEEMAGNEEVTEQHVFYDELGGEAHEEKHEVAQESTTYSHIDDHPVQGQSQEATSQGQEQPEPFTDHSVPSNWEGYTTEDPNQPLKHSESPTVGIFEQKEPVKESTTSDHEPEGTPSSQHGTDISEFESPNIRPNPVEAVGPERGSSEEVEFTTMKIYETEQTLNQNGETEIVITHTESTESDLHLNEDEDNQETSDISHTLSTDEHSSSSEHAEEEPQAEITHDSEHSSMNEGTADVVGTEHEEILTATEQSHTPDSIHEQVQQEHVHVPAEDSSSVDSTEAEESHVEHSHDADANVEDQHLIPTESSEINSYPDSTEEQHSEKYPEGISHTENTDEHSSPSEHTLEEASTETANENEHFIVPEENTELVGVEHEEILTATEQSHTPEPIHEVYGENTILPADHSSQAPSTASPVTDGGHYLEENSENGDEKKATDKPSVAEDISSPVGNHEELPTKEEEVTEANSEVTADYSSETTELGVIKESHVTDSYEEAHVTNIDEEDKKQHVPDIHEDSKLESETSTSESTSEHQQPEDEQPEHQLSEHEQSEHQLPEHEQTEHQLPEHEQPEHQLPEHEQSEHQSPEHEQSEHKQPEHKQPEHKQPEHKQPEHQLPEHKQPEHQLSEHEQPEHQLPEHEQPEPQLPEHEQPEHHLPEHEQPEHPLPEHEQPEHQLPEHEQPDHQQPEQQTEEVTHIELHEDVPVSSITSEDHRITEDESAEQSAHHHHHMDNVNAVIDDTVHENYDYTTDNAVKPTSQEDSSPSESVNIDHSGNENTEVHESHDDQENDPLEGSADLVNNNNGLLESTVTPAIISEQEHLFPVGNIDTGKPLQEADVEHTQDNEQEEVTTENFHLFDLSTPSHQMLPITPGPPGIDVSDLIHKEESSTDKEYEPEESTEHGDSNLDTNLESQTGEPSLEETLTSENVPEEVEEEQKKDVVHPEVSSEVPDKEHIEHVTDGITNNETSDDAEENSTHISLDEDHIGESISSELPNTEGESVSETVPSVVESDEKHVTDDISQSEDHLEGEHHISTDQTQGHQDELHEADPTHNAYVPTETIDVTTNAGVSAEDTATSAENVHEADASKVPENVSPEKEEEDKGQTEENLTSHQDDTESEHKEPVVHEGIDESVTELEKIHEESTQSVDTHNELPPTTVVDKDESSSAAVGEQVTEGGEAASSLDVDTETESHGEKLEEPVKEEHTEKVDVAEQTVSSSDSDNENIFVNYLESSSSRTPASDNQVLETTEQHFDENAVETVTDHYSATEISSTGESNADDSSLTSDTKPDHPDIHSQVPAVDENLTAPASEVSISAGHQESEIHSDTQTTTDTVLEGSGLEETSSFSAVPIESQSIPESGFETATGLETMFGPSSPETSTSGDSEFHQESISQTSDLSHEDHVTDAADKPEGVKQDHLPEDSTTLTSETSTAAVHAETESTHLEPQEPVKEHTESTSEIVLEGHVSETITATEETAAPPSSTVKVTHGQELHEEHITTTSPHQTSYVPTEQTSPSQGIHHHENIAGIHPSPPLFPGWTQKPFEHHTTSEPPPHLPEDSHYPSGFEQDYEDDDGASYGPGTCRYGGKVYLSAQQIPRDDPCDFCFCFRSDIICLQQSCPPPIKGCYQETIKGFCCPRYECHVSMATMLNITTTTTTTTTTLPPHFFAHAYKGAAMKAGCQVKGVAYNVGDRIPTTSGPCLQCRCGANGQMKCEPTVCGPQEALLRQVMDAAAISKRR